MSGGGTRQLAKTELKQEPIMCSCGFAVAYLADFLLKSVTRIVQGRHALIKALACGGFGLAVLLWARGGAWAQTSFQNTNPISLPNTVSSVGPLDANPYPSQISVSGLTGTISKVTVT